MSPIFIGNRRIYGPESSDPGGLGANDEGSIVYNTTDDVLKAWDGSAWSALGSGGGGGGGSQTYSTLVQGAYGSSNISGLSWSGTAVNDVGGVSSLAIPTNRKTYIEILWSSDGGGNPGAGVCAGQNTELGLAGPKGWWRGGGQNGMETSTWTFSDVSGGAGTGFSTGQYIGIGMDNTANSGNGSITFYRNGTAIFSGGSGWTGRNDLYFHWQNNGTGTSSGTFNFGASSFQYPLSGYGGLYS